MTLQQAILTSKSDLKLMPKIAEACRKFLTYLATVKQPHTLNHLPLSFIQEKSELSSSQDTLDLCRYLTGYIDVLDKHFIFIDENNDIEEELELEEIKQAKVDGYLIHPVTGQCVTDYEPYVYVFFSVNQMLFKD